MTSDTEQFALKFWGVRGSIPVADQSCVRYGGNTSCIEVWAAGHLIILDAGSGIFNLGKRLAKNKAMTQATLLFSHTHWDHICGFPFFAPSFNPNFTLDIYSGHLRSQTSKEVFRMQMLEPFFPLPLEAMGAAQSFHDFIAGDSLDIIKGVSIQTISLNHPGGATGYRIGVGNKSICYITDTEHVIGAIDKRIVEFIRDTDVFIYDATYTDEDYETHVGWGHSTWQEGLKLAEVADVGKYVLFHHDPLRTDKKLSEIEAELQAKRENSLAAYEGCVIELSGHIGK